MGHKIGRLDRHVDAEAAGVRNNLRKPMGALRRCVGSRSGPALDPGRTGSPSRAGLPSMLEEGDGRESSASSDDLERQSTSGCFTPDSDSWADIPGRQLRTSAGLVHRIIAWGRVH